MSEQLNNEDKKILLMIVEQGTYKGTDVEKISQIKNKLKLGMLIKDKIKGGKDDS